MYAFHVIVSVAPVVLTYIYLFKKNKKTKSCFQIDHAFAYKYYNNIIIISLQQITCIECFKYTFDANKLFNPTPQPLHQNEKNNLIWNIYM